VRRYAVDLKPRKCRMDISQLRGALDRIDHDLVRLAAERQRIVAEIGRNKRGTGRPLRDFKREKEVLDNVRGHALAEGIDPQLAADLMELLIAASLTRQEKDTVRAASQGDGKHALVIGGNGRMGGWFARFLDAQGYAVEIADPAGAPDGFAHRARWDEGVLNQDLIVVATPLRAAARILAGLAEHRPAGVVFDLGSIKTPLREPLRALQQAGVRVTSIHPMFARGAPRGARRYRGSGRAGDGARIVRLDHRDHRRNGPGRARPPDRTGAGFVACAEYCFFFGACGQRGRTGPTQGRVIDHVQRAAGDRRRGRCRKSTTLFRDSIVE